MKLLEIIRVGAKPNYFELMNLSSTVDEDVFKQLLRDRGMHPSFNGIAIDKDVEDLMVLFSSDIRKHLVETYDYTTAFDPFELFVGIYRFSYDVKAQCMYLEEKYALKHTAGKKAGARTVVLYERVSTNGSSNVIKFLTKDRFDKVLQERKADLIDMRTVLGMTSS